MQIVFSKSESTRSNAIILSLVIAEMRYKVNLLDEELQLRRKELSILVNYKVCICSILSFTFYLAIVHYSLSENGKYVFRPFRFGGNVQTSASRGDGPFGNPFIWPWDEMVERPTCNYNVRQFLSRFIL